MAFCVCTHDDDDCIWVWALTIPMHLGNINGPFVPHNPISAQGTPVPLLKFQMTPRLKLLMSSGSKVCTHGEPPVGWLNLKRHKVTLLLRTAFEKYSTFSWNIKCNWTIESVFFLVINLVNGTYIFIMVICSAPFMALVSTEDMNMLVVWTPAWKTCTLVKGGLVCPVVCNIMGL